MFSYRNEAGYIPWPCLLLPAVYQSALHVCKSSFAFEQCLFRRFGTWDAAKRNTAYTPGGGALRACRHACGGTAPAVFRRPGRRNVRPCSVRIQFSCSLVPGFVPPLLSEKHIKNPPRGSPSGRMCLRYMNRLRAPSVPLPRAAPRCLPEAIPPPEEYRLCPTPP